MINLFGVKLRSPWFKDNISLTVCLTPSTACLVVNASLMYSVYYGLAPKSICNLFHKTEPRRYHLRKAEGFNVPKYNYSIGRTSLSYRGPIAWNILPESYKLVNSWATFKQKIKKDLALLDKLSFEKESCLSTNKNEDFYYF